MREYLLDSPRPISSEELHTLLRNVVAADGTLTRKQADAIRITSAVHDNGTHIERLHLNLSGTKLSPRQLEATAKEREQDSPKEPAKPFVPTVVQVDAASFAAKPLKLGPLELKAEGSASNVRFAWLEDANGGLWVEHLKSADGKPGKAQAEFELDLRDIEPLAREVLERADSKAKLLEFDPEVETPNDHEAVVRIAMRCGYGILRASIIATAHASIDDDMVVHVHDVKFSSKNPALALVYKALERIVLRDGRIPRRIAINEQLPAGIELTDARIRAVGTRLTVTGEVLAEGEADFPA